MLLLSSSSAVHLFLLLLLISPFCICADEIVPPISLSQINASSSLSLPNNLPASENGTQNANETQQNGGGPLAEQRALAAPTVRANGGGKLSENAVEVNGERKPFIKIHYRDGFQKAIFDETQQRRALPDFEDNNDVGRGGGGGEFDAYDDSRLVDPRFEQPLFIPEIYRNDTEEEAKGPSPPPPQRGPAQPQQPLPAGRTPLVSTDLQSRQPIAVRTTTARPFPGPPAPSIRPAQPFGRQPPPPGQLQATLRPPQGFQPPQQTDRQPSPNFPSQQFLRPPSQPLPPPPQPFFPRPSPTSQNPQLPSLPLLPPLPPPNPPTNQQRPSMPNSPHGQLRSGVCPHSIFYTPQAVTEFDLQRIYTHFALVVSIDQCARTCHEFNCDVAILDPISRHCQFNPSTAFRLHPSCPQWPNPLYRNNVQLTQDPVRIACVTCQQRKRIPRPGQNVNSPMPFNGLSRQQQQSFPIQRPPQFPSAQPPNVIRTTDRERIDTAANIDGQFRIANSARALGEETAEGGRDLSAEFHKLESLLKSAEDYLDETEHQVNGQKKAEKRNKGREVQSWQDGHPQGDGHSPLKINPLRRPYLVSMDKPHAIFYSTDKLGQRKREGSDEFRRRSHRNTDELTNQ